MTPASPDEGAWNITPSKRFAYERFTGTDLREDPTLCGVGEDRDPSHRGTSVERIVLRLRHELLDIADRYRHISWICPPAR